MNPILIGPWARASEGPRSSRTASAVKPMRSRTVTALLRSWPPSMSTRVGIAPQQARGGPEVGRRRPSGEEEREDHRECEHRPDDEEGHADGELPAEPGVQPDHLQAHEDEHGGQPVAEEMELVDGPAQHEVHG